MVIKLQTNDSFNNLNIRRKKISYVMTMEQPNLWGRVLIVSPHTDDGEISAGGTIAKIKENKGDLYYVTFSHMDKSIIANNADEKLLQECKNSLKELEIPARKSFFYNYETREFLKSRQNILDNLIEIGRDINPTLIICPSSFDVHQDHQIVHNECVRAFKKMSSLWGMEHPWNNLIFRTDIFVQLEERHLTKKIKALRQYSSQTKRDYFDEDYIKSWAFTRGMNIGSTNAEVFECIRMKF